MLLKHAPPSVLSRRPAADLYVSQLWVMTPPASVPTAVTRRACMEIVQIGLLLHNKLAMFIPRSNGSQWHFACVDILISSINPFRSRISTLNFISMDGQQTT